MTSSFYRPGVLAHQLEAFERFKDASHFALIFDPRCRKTGTALAIWRHHVERGTADALVVLCADLGGVKWVWQEEAGKELPPEFLADTKILVWQSGKSDGSEVNKRATKALREHPGPVILSMNAAAALRSENAWKYLQWFIARRRVMLVADESSCFAQYSGQTRRLLTLGGWYGRSTPTVVVRAILDGTPVDESPFDIYYPSEFLQRGALGYAEKAAFQARYGNYEFEWLDVPLSNGTVVQRQVPAGKRFNRAKAAHGDPDPYDRYPVMNGYRNLDELRERLFKFAMRVRREDVSDAPAKQYESVYFELTKKQRDFYDKLVEEYIADLAQGPMPVREVLKRATRLQMVARNYWPPERGAEDCITCDGWGLMDDGEECTACEGLGKRIIWSQLERIDPDNNPAKDALVGRLRSGGPYVVWCRFKQDAQDVLEALRAVDLDPLPYWGDYPDAICQENYQKFRGGGCNGIVATMMGGPSYGKDLSRAETMVYYSNEWKMRLRRQTEDRAEGILKKFPTTIVDLIAVDTRDLDVVEALRAKRDLAALVLGDPRPWLGASE